MIFPEEEKAILARAYVPEHSVELMTRISGGEPFLSEDYFLCRTGYGIIVVGYPLGSDFKRAEFEETLRRIIKTFRPAKVSLIAPEAPASFETAFVERASDQYYTLDLPVKAVRGNLARLVRKAREAGFVDQSERLTDAHRDLVREFLGRAAPPPRIRELLLKMWDYVGKAGEALVLNAWDGARRLAAFFVVDFAPKDFSTYVIGCHSKTNYLPGASDLLMSELIKMSEASGKRFIHLGIGVNPGIRTFKEKWGGIPTRTYELCELALKKPTLLDALLKGVSRA
jgi:hypothetical protein